MDILDDNIPIPSPNPQPLPLDDSRRANTNDTLVTADIQRAPSSIVIRTRNPGSVSTGILDPGLPGGRSTRADGGARAAALCRCSPFGPGKVPGAVDEDDAGRAICDPFFQSVTISWEFGISGRL